MIHILQLFFIVVVVFLLNPHLLLITSVPDYFYCGFSTKSCGNGERIEYPFYFEYSKYKYDCGYPGLSAKCSERGRPFITISNHYYFYEHIGDFVLLMDVDTADQRCPQPKHNFSLEGVVASSLGMYDDPMNATYFYNCTTLPKDVKPNLPCIDQNNGNASGRSFAVMDYNMPEGFNWYGNCQEKVVVPVSYYSSNGSKTNFTVMYDLYLFLHQSEDCRNCEKSGGSCSYNRKSTSFRCNCDPKGMLFDKICPTYSSQDKRIPHSSVMDKRIPHSSKGNKGILRKLIIGVGLFAGIGGSLLISLFLYRRCSKTSTSNVEILLQECESNVLQRYKYSHIKKMTNFFEDILGQGGFGFVFKGKLPNGRMVAVKLLNKSKGDGEEFINEVVTISRTNHVNIVTLIGFCNEGTKQALVYEFMVNGSLEKFIYKEKSSTIAYAPALGWEKLYQIILGIARGLEYLHRGCNSRILNFDIKPHNILLDSEFVPKIFDFGLAKLSQTRESIVSMVGTRGTNGYIAPELYSRKFGVVSYKSDVYSYGMMLFEMIGGRKNIDATVDNISEIYFPHWIYNHLNKENETIGSEDVQIDVSEDILQNEIARKMIIVALWCIQSHPTDRPSMNTVVEMLEATNEKLQMPHNPFLHPSSGISPLLS